MRAPRSVSTSYASFEAELEGTILQHTGAVDYYLQTTAPKWPLAGAAAADEHATPAKLHEAFLADCSSSFWQAFAHGRGEISVFDDLALGPTVIAAPRLVATAAQEPFGRVQRQSKRRPRTRPLQVGESPLEQFLAADLQRFIDLQQQQQQDVQAIEAAAALTARAHHSRASSSGSFVRLPHEGPCAWGDGEEGGGATPAAAALAAAAAMAAVNDALSSPPGSPALGSPRGAPPPPPAQAPAGPAHVLPAAAAAEAAVAAATTAAAAEAGRAAPAGAPAAPPPLTAAELDDDDEIAVQKAAARARLAELEGGAAATASALAPPAHGGKAPPAGKSLGDERRRQAPPPGSVHSSHVPARPHAGARAVQLHSAGPAAGKAELPRLRPGAAVQHYRFSQSMVGGLVLCMALLPALWAAQAWASGSSPLQSWLSGRVQAYSGYFYVPAAAALLLYVFGSALLLRPPLLHFPNAEVEQRYLMWSNDGKLFVDSLFQGLFLLVGGWLWVRLKHAGGGGEDVAEANARALTAVVSVTGCGLPAVLLLLVRSCRYACWREQLLVGSRVCSIAALLAMQLSLPAPREAQLPLSMPFMVLAQLMGIACMQVRLATFVPCQVLHLLVLLLRTRAPNPLLHFVQLFGGGLCLPYLLLHGMELYSRKAFLATVANGAGGGPEALAASAAAKKSL